MAVITNGTAVLGLGNIGALAGKPVMEGKGVLFKRFADIDVFDIEVDTEDPEEFIRTVKLLEPTFGGINLEDIKAPECFEIERRLKARDEHPGLPRRPARHGDHLRRRAAQRARPRRQEDRGGAVVFSGAGAAAIACAGLYLELGVAAREHRHVRQRRAWSIRAATEDMNPYKERVRRRHRRAHARRSAGRRRRLHRPLGRRRGRARRCSAAWRATRSSSRSPTPTPRSPTRTRGRRAPDAIVATGRSDYPNQVNNVLGFPFIFRGALDVRATDINDEMKLAAVKALAALAREDVPDAVLRGLRPRVAPLRPRLPDPQAVRLPRAAVSGAGGGAGGDGDRGGAGADRRLRGLPPAAGDADLAPPE